MLKPSYDTLETVPENLRGAYVQSGGKWVLDDLDAGHPVVVKRDELLRENSSQKGTITRLTNERAALEGSSLPPNHAAVPQSDKALLDAAKEAGFATAEEVKRAKVASAELETRKSADHLREVAKLLSYEPEAFVRLQNLPEFEIRDGREDKKEVIAKVKDDKGVVTEKAAGEFVESSPDIAPFLPALKASQSGGTRVHGTSSTGGSPGPDRHQKIRDEVKKKEEARAGAGSELHPIFKPHQQAAAS